MDGLGTTQVLLRFDLGEHRRGEVVEYPADRAAALIRNGHATFQAEGRVKPQGSELARIRLRFALGPHPAGIVVDYPARRAAALVRDGYATAVMTAGETITAAVDSLRPAKAALKKK